MTRHWSHEMSRTTACAARWLQVYGRGILPGRDHPVVGCWWARLDILRDGAEMPPGMSRVQTLVTAGVIGVLATTTLLAGHGASADSTTDAVANREPLRLSAPSADPLEGTSSWRLLQPAASGQIEGYPSAVSGLPGEPIELSVSTIDPWFTVKAYRFGDYSGGAAHLVGSTGNLAGVRQPPPVFSPYETRTVRANWPTTVSLATGGWSPGVYLLKLTSSSGFDSYVPYIVRSASTAGTVALVLPVTTWQAYNDWG